MDEEDIKWALRLACLVIVPMVLVSLLGHYLTKASCANSWPSRETRQEWNTGCLVKVRGEWVPEKSIKIAE